MPTSPNYNLVYTGGRGGSHRPRTTLIFIFFDARNPLGIGTGNGYSQRGGIGDLDLALCDLHLRRPLLVVGSKVSKVPPSSTLDRMGIGTRQTLEHDRVAVRQDQPGPQEEPV